MSPTETFTDFPSKLAAIPTVVIDTREQLPLPISRLPVARVGLSTGDYSVLGAENLFAVERKSIADLVSSVTTERERFERELVRLRGYEFRRLLIVGTKLEIERHKYCSNVSPRAVLASLSAFDARYAPVVFAPTPEVAAVMVERWVVWFTYTIQSAADALARASKNKGSTRANEQSQNFEPSSLESSDESSLANISE